MSKKRKLTEDDRAVWQHVSRQVAPLRPKTAEVFEPPAEIRKSVKPKPITRREPIAPFQIGEKAKAAKPPSTAPAALATRSDPHNMDKRNFRRLIRGQMDIDVVLDLHGMTADQARQQLFLAVRRGAAQGQRMLLVITGKGNTKRRDEFNRMTSGILRRSLPEWLQNPSISHLVLQVSTAHPKHGGSGAYYVYLRRNR